MVGAAVSAEYLQAYLPQTGDALVLVGGLLVLGPLYGGAALLIRETALRTGRGWTGVLLLAAAFGVLMTSLVDQSLWQVHDPGIAYWDDLREATLLGPLGFAAFPVLSWVTGHVVYSIGAPIVLLDALAPSQRGRPLLGRTGLVVVAALSVGAALLIRSDPGYVVSGATGKQTWLSLLVAGALVGLALSPVGRPRQRRPSVRSSWTPARTLVLAVVVLTALDLLPFTWIGVGVLVVVLTLAGWWSARVSASADWGPRHVTALGVAAVLERTLTGVISPLPPGVGADEKAVQSVLLLALVTAVGVAAWRVAAAPEMTVPTTNRYTDLR